MDQPKKPWDIDARLALEYLVIVAQIIERVRRESVAAMEKDKGDLKFGNWVVGTTAHSRIAFEITAASELYEWLKVVDDSMQFTFSIEGVPIRILRSEVDEDSQKASSKNAVKHGLRERQAQLAAFDLDEFTDPKLEWLWRIFVETDLKGEAFRITLLQIHRTSGDIRYPFEIPFRRVNGGVGGLSDTRPEGKEFPAPMVGQLTEDSTTGTDTDSDEHDELASNE